MVRNFKTHFIANVLLAFLVVVVWHDEGENELREHENHAEQTLPDKQIRVNMLIDVLDYEEEVNSRFRNDEKRNEQVENDVGWETAGYLVK